MADLIKQITNDLQKKIDSFEAKVEIADIGTVMDLSRHTVGGYVKSIYHKLDISSRAEAALQAKHQIK